MGRLLGRDIGISLVVVIFVNENIVKALMPPTSLPTSLPSFYTPTSIPTHLPSQTPTFLPTAIPTDPLPSPLPTHVPTKEGCYPNEILLDFYSANITINNLGGVGPDTEMAKELRYSNVGTVDDRSIDFIVKTIDSSTYNGNADVNGQSGQFGIINLEIGGDTTFHFEFEYTKSRGVNVRLPVFTFTLFDLDKSVSGHVESMCIDGGSYNFPKIGGDLIAQENSTNSCDGSQGSSLSIVAGKEGFQCDNPSDPLELGLVTSETCTNEDASYLPINQLNRSAEFVFRDTSNFNMTFRIKGSVTSNTNKGRNFLFAGKSNLAKCPTPTPRPSTTPSLIPSPSPSELPTGSPIPTIKPTPVPTTVAPSSTPLPTTPSPSPVPSVFPSASASPTGTPAPSVTFAPTALIEWDDKCTFTEKWLEDEVPLIRGNTEVITTIPAQRSKVMFRMNASADADFGLYYYKWASGEREEVPLLQRGAGDEFDAYNWQNDDTTSQAQWTFYQMSFRACTDSCTDALSVTYSDGDVRSVQGDPGGAIEWLYINATTTDLVLKVRSFGEGTAYLRSQWDCSSSCIYSPVYEVQTLKVIMSSLDGNYTLSYDGAETSSIQVDAAGREVALALESLDTISNTMTVTRHNVSSTYLIYSITFSGYAGNMNLFAVSTSYGVHNISIEEVVTGRKEGSCYPTIMYPSSAPTNPPSLVPTTLNPTPVPSTPDPTHSPSTSNPTSTASRVPISSATISPSSSLASTSESTSNPTMIPTFIVNARRSATTDDDDCIESLPTLLGSLFSLVVGFLIGAFFLFGIQKKKIKQVTPTIEAEDSAYDEHDDDGIRDPEMTEVEEGRPRLSVVSIANIKARARKAADHTRERVRAKVQAIKQKHEEELQKIEEERRAKQLEELMDPPFDDDVADHGMVHELSEVMQLHEREQEALRTLYDNKREAAAAAITERYVEQKNEMIEIAKSKGEQPSEEELIALDEERDNQKAILESSLSKLEREIQQELALRQIRQQKQVNGDGSTLAAEVRRLKKNHEKEEQDLVQALEAETKRKREALKERLEARRRKKENDYAMVDGPVNEVELEQALLALDGEYECALNLLEMDAIQQKETALVKERRRAMKEIGQDLDPAAEMEWLKDQHIQASAMLAQAMDSEQARRKAKLRERMEARKYEKNRAYMDANGKVISGKEDEFAGALEEISHLEATYQEKLERSYKQEKKNMEKQLKARQEATEKRVDDFNRRAYELQQEQKLRSKELEGTLRDLHDEKSSKLMQRLKERRAKKARELQATDMSPDEIAQELQQLNEQDLEELAELNKGMQQDLTASVSKKLEESKRAYEALLQKDTAIAAIEATDQMEMRNLLEKHIKDRANLEGSLDAKRRRSKEALKARLDAQKKRALQAQMTGGAGDAESGDRLENELLIEEQEEVDKIELDCLEESDKKWEKSQQETQEKMIKASVTASNQAQNVREGLESLQAQHYKAMEKLDKELAVKKKKRKDALQERLEKKRKQAKAKTYSSDEERRELEKEIADEEMQELQVIEKEENEAFQQLKAKQIGEANTLMAKLDEDRMISAASDAENAAEAREQALLALQQIKDRHKQEIDRMHREVEQKKKEKKKGLQQRLAKKRREKERELKKRANKMSAEEKEKEMTDLVQQEQREAAELEARLDAEHALEISAKETEIAQKMADLELDAKLKIEEAASKEQQAAALKASSEAKAAGDGIQHDEEAIRKMVAQQQEQAERFNEEINKRLGRAHKSVADRVAKRRRRRESQHTREQARKRDGLQLQLNDEMRNAKADLMHVGLSEEDLALADSAMKEEMQQYREERDSLRKKVRILEEQLDNVAETSDAQDKLEERERQRALLEKELNDAETKFSKQLRSAVQAKEAMEEKLVDLEMQLSSGPNSEELERKDEQIKELNAEIEKSVAESASKVEKARADAETAAAEERGKLKSQLDEVTEQAENMKKQLEDIGDVDALKEKAAATEQAQAARAAAEEAAKVAENKMQEHWETLKKEQKLRKKLHNQVEDMKGKIRVFARGRPMSTSEEERGCNVSVEYLDVTTVATKDPDPDHPADKTFTFDAVFPPEVGQEEVFEDCQQLLESVLDGYNVCVFAYGQTGSGKTWTMGGIPGNEGLTPRCVSTLFSRLEEEKAVLTYKVSCYFVELYNDALVDLLQKVHHPKEKPQKLDIKLNQKKQVYIRNAEVREVTNAGEMMSLFSKGNAVRHVGATKMNAQSSRSHSIFSILVETTAKTTGKTNYGKLSLIDLAGSERAAKTGASAEQLKEANSINKSLSCLGDVISALTEGDSYIPYRNNKLTMLMQDSLGGNAKTLMFVNFSPADYNFDETNGSLTYAQRVKQIKNTVEKSQESKEVKKLNSQITRLQAMLDSAGLAANLETDHAGDEEVVEDS